MAAASSASRLSLLLESLSFLSPGECFILTPFYEDSHPDLTHQFMLWLLHDPTKTSLTIHFDDILLLFHSSGIIITAPFSQLSSFRPLCASCPFVELYPVESLSASHLYDFILPFPSIYTLSGSTPGFIGILSEKLGRIINVVKLPENVVDLVNIIEPVFINYLMNNLVTKYLNLLNDSLLFINSKIFKTKKFPRQELCQILSDPLMISFDHATIRKSPINHFDCKTLEPVINQVDDCILIEVADPFHPIKFVRTFNINSDQFHLQSLCFSELDDVFFTLSSRDVDCNDLNRLIQERTLNSLLKSTFLSTFTVNVEVRQSKINVNHFLNGQLYYIEVVLKNQNDSTFKFGDSYYLFKLNSDIYKGCLTSKYSRFLNFKTEICASRISLVKNNFQFNDFYSKFIHSFSDLNCRLNLKNVYSSVRNCRFLIYETGLILTNPINHVTTPFFEPFNQFLTFDDVAEITMSSVSSEIKLRITLKSGLVFDLFRSIKWPIQSYKIVRSLLSDKVAFRLDDEFFTYSPDNQLQSVSDQIVQSNSTDFSSTATDSNPSSQSITQSITLIVMSIEADFSFFSSISSLNPFFVTESFDFSTILREYLNPYLILPLNSNIISVIQKIKQTSLHFIIKNLVVVSPSFYLPNNSLIYDSFLLNSARFATLVVTSEANFGLIKSFNPRALVSTFDDMPNISGKFSNCTIHIPPNFENSDQIFVEPYQKLNIVSLNTDFYSIKKSDFTLLMDNLINNLPLRKVLFISGMIKFNSKSNYLHIKYEKGKFSMTAAEELSFMDDCLSTWIGQKRQDSITLIGYGLCSSDIVSLFREYLDQKNTKKPIVTRDSLSRDQIRSIQAKTKHIKAPEGWFFNGHVWMSIDGSTSMFHPNQVSFVDDFVDRLNDNL
ncbi:hypothetical protein P9112_008091 [Eukaryota sp. TZLM1-RC]